MRVIVIGGGAVGLCVAETLSARDCEVTVIERDRCGAGASAGNAGWITPSLAAPVPGPGVISAALRWLVDPSGPLWIRPTLSPAMVEWLARFIVGCRRSTYRRTLGALQRAAARAGPGFDAMAARGVELELHEDPLLFPAFERGELEHLWHLAHELHEAGSTQRFERLSAEELRAVEPALGPDLLGGVLAHGERRVRPELLSAGVRRALIARGVEVLEGMPVTRLARDGGGWRLDGPRGTARRAEAVVIAAGLASAALLAAHGVRVPIAAAKGYSRTYPADPTAPRQPLYLENAKVAISVFDGSVRVSGTLELGARGLALSGRRLAAITAAAQRALPGWRMPARRRDWAGMRPLSPDGLPFIGPVPGLEGVHLATGHSTLGITLAPLTGELVAGLLLDGARDELLAAFDPARALRRTDKANIGGAQ
ncbi:MAG TPA: FAD-dependent oxidoreductase [Solirubrobacteraceae bacterium]|nr:FAD-dependent oxidoreductase [Solirubrobacteraceae bacterium]